jgi:CDGSH-type Zn-finger protein
MQIRATTNGKFGSCGCGRSKTGDCDGSHSYTPEQWAKIQEDEFLNEDDKNRGSDQDHV